VSAGSDRRHKRKRIRSILHRRKGAPGLAFELDRGALKDMAAIIVAAVLLVIASFWLASRYIRPAPPDSFVMATGPDGGAYQLFAQRYRDILARDAITIELQSSRGSIDNVQLLTASGSNVQAALVQAGASAGAAPEELRSLGALYYEPLWIFYRGARELARINELAALRVAVGTEGSGTRALALELLRAVGADTGRANFQPLGGAQAAEALRAGKVDAAFVVGAPDAGIVQQLLHAEGIRLLSLDNAEAFARRFPHLTALTLPSGVLDLRAHIPPHEVTLLATTALLVVRADFHPALAFLLLNAASEVHSPSGLLQRHREFPAARESEFALSPEAERYLRDGPPFLRRYLPFWLANLIERMVVLLVPLLAVLVPVFKFLPALLDWRIKRRVFRWYGEVRYLEEELALDPDPAHAPAMLQRLDEIERGVTRTSVPNAYSDYVYNLRTHLDVVRNRILRTTRPAAPAPESAPADAMLNPAEPPPRRD
jgi:TRAP transporter TAXI family solute receptor